MLLDPIVARIAAAIPEARLEIIPNASPCAQHSLLVDSRHALAVATFLRDAPLLRFDYASNVTGGRLARYGAQAESGPQTNHRGIGKGD